MESKLFYQVALSKIPGIGPIHARNLLSHFQEPASIINASIESLCLVEGIGKTLAEAIKSEEYFSETRKEIDWILKNDVKTLFIDDKNYPEKLKFLSDAPILLYQKGKCSLNHPRNIAIIGTRKPSPRGIINCEKIIEGLKPYDVQIISGLAYGIDICAHKSALKHQIPTIAVLAHGLNQIYPAAHRPQARKMLKDGGLISEFSINDGPEREHFPMRNRIVAGLCDALIVIESGIKGGSIITSEYAVNYNKDVFAIPGRLKDRNAQGCNRLIKINKASLLESAEDIAYIMGWDPKTKVPKQQELFVDLNEREQKILKALEINGESSFDKLAYEVQSQNSQLATLLLNLEFKGLIKSVPGNRFILI